MFVLKTALYYLTFVIVSYMVNGHHQHHHNHNTLHHVDTTDSLISNKELRRVSEEIYEMIPYGLIQSIDINYQAKRDTKDAKDEAPEPLLFVPMDLFEIIPPIEAMRKLFDNYDINAYHHEYITPEEDIEENQFIDSILSRKLMIHTMDFLASKGYFAKNLHQYKKVLKKIWFQPYSRFNRTELGSSGFEHVFMVEKKRSRYITGMHNWVFYADEENHNRANYLGYIAKEQVGEKAAVIKFYLSYLDKIKLTSMFIGTPPEFEIALYTLCFYARPNKACKVTLGHVKVTIQTMVEFHNNEPFISTAFPKIYTSS